MSERLLWVFGFLVICFLGFVVIRFSYGENLKERDFSLEFIGRFNQYIGSHGEDHDSYGWLIHRSNKMQAQMGGSGLVALYRLPYQNFQYRNYPIILNLLPQLHQVLKDDLLSRGALANSYASTLHESMVRYIGVIDDRGEVLVAKLKNPFIWFSSGVDALLALPFRILGWIGVLGSAGVQFVTSNFVFKTAAAFIAFIGLVSSIIGIVTGWEPFLQWAIKYPLLAKIIIYIQ